jgi:galactonate dehydratase
VTIRAVEAVPARIRRDEAYLGALPEGVDPNRYFLRAPYRALYSRHFETAFVKLTSDDGTVGWGEALAPVAPEVVCTIVEQLLAPVLEGSDPLEGNVLWDRMYNLMRERGYYGGFMLDAISACDIALWDLRGKLLGQPVHTLLGGAHRKDLPCYVSGLPRPTAEERAELALFWQQQGFEAFKLAAGHGVGADTESVASLREALGESATLLLDAHWVYSVDEALALGRRLEALDASVLEAPLNPEDVAGHARLAQELTLKVAVGETERSRFQFLPWLEQRAVGLIKPDVGRTGISELVKIAQMAEAFNVPVAPHLSVQQGVAIAAAIQAAASLPNLWLLEFQPPVFALANSLLREPIVCEAGHYRLPEGPGLGVAIDEHRLAEAQA